MALYHRDLGFPAGIQLPAGRFSIIYGKHARTEAERDRYAPIRLPASVLLDGSETVELELDSASVPVKAVIRVAYDYRHDLVLVIVPDRAGHVFCKTVWLNERNDIHATLKTGRYVRP